MIGSRIALRHHGGGRVALVLKDEEGNRYALTCSHVLDTDPARRPRVYDGSGAGVGVLWYRTVLSSQHSNLLDCALVKLDPGVWNNRIPQSTERVMGLSTARPGLTARIVSHSAFIPAAVVSTAVRTRIFDHHRLTEIPFEGLFKLSAEEVAPGDSGSLVLGADRTALGMLIATIATNTALACPIETILLTLSTQIGSPLTLA